jgi:hypothetical protein
LNDVLNATISMNLKLKEKMNHDDSNLDIKLGTLARNIKKEVCKIIDSFLSFLTRYDERKVHNKVQTIFFVEYFNKTFRLFFKIMNFFIALC